MAAHFRLRPPLLLGAAVLSVILVPQALPQAAGKRGSVRKKGIEVDLRSVGRQIADEVAQKGAGVPADATTPAAAVPAPSQVQLSGGNVQVNDAGLDNIQVFNGTRPYVKYTQSETSVAVDGSNVVAAYNTSANQPIVQVGGRLTFTRRFLSGYSNSTDGGKTWTSGFFPPLPGSIYTFGDPVVAVDRHGNFYFSGLGADAAGRSTIQVNKSTDGGQTWGAAVLVQQDNGGDKEWLAVGPDPRRMSRDNVYVTWTSFQASGAQLRFGRSTDGGVTFTSRTIYSPSADPDPTHPQNALQYSNVVVDQSNGRLYVPFAHFSNSDVDFICVLVSDDAGDTFRFLEFDVEGAPGPTLLPVVAAGELIDCGDSGSFRLSIHSGQNVGGRSGLPSYVNASRLTLQPAFRARNDVLYLAWSNSTSGTWGATAASNVLFIRSDDAGATWTSPVPVNPSSSADFAHVLPALDVDANSVYVSYYTQHTNGSIDLDFAVSTDRGDTFPSSRRVTGTSFALAPTNIPLSPPAGPNYATTNYDRLIRPCYCLGEYQGITKDGGSVYVVWGDNRNTVTQPVHPLDPISGLTHAQEDVFYQEVKAQ